MLTKLLNNRISNNLIGVNITEYDIRRAHVSILNLLYPDNPLIRELNGIPKEQYTYRIGNMIKDRPQLRKEIDDKALELFNLFIESNSILDDNILATTPDSLLILDQIAQKTIFYNGIVNFVNKENISYSSLFYYTSYKYILFDRITKRMRIKGVGSENIVKDYPFVKTILTKLCTILDNSTIISHESLLKHLKDIRIEYMYSDNINIYRDITHKNQFKYNIDGREVYSDILLNEDENCILIKSDNYLNFIFPLMRSFIW